MVGEQLIFVAPVVVGGEVDTSEVDGFEDRHAVFDTSVDAVDDFDLFELGVVTTSAHV